MLACDLQHKRRSQLNLGLFYLSQCSRHWWVLLTNINSFPSFLWDVTPSPLLCQWVLGWGHFSTRYRSETATWAWPSRALCPCGHRNWLRPRRGNQVCWGHCRETEAHTPSELGSHLSADWSEAVSSPITISGACEWHRCGAERCQELGRDLGLGALFGPYLKLHLPLNLSILWANKFPFCLRQRCIFCPLQQKTHPQQ